MLHSLSHNTTPFSLPFPPLFFYPCLLVLSALCVSMKVFEVGDSVSRFRLAESCVGLAGCLCVAYSVWTPCWLNDKGLWTNGDNSTNTDIDQTRGIIFNGESRSCIDRQRPFI